MHPGHISSTLDWGSGLSSCQLGLDNLPRGNQPWQREGVNYQMGLVKGSSQKRVWYDDGQSKTTHVNVKSSDCSIQVRDSKGLKLKGVSGDGEIPRKNQLVMID